MKIKTITCHEVYNYGASLQEYALLKYLENKGHAAEAIHYKPAYLSNHFNMKSISSKYNVFPIKYIYLLVKLPSRLKALKRKKTFDAFSSKYIKTGKNIYINNRELKENLPDADAYICGSDQIWNSFFQNGKDPAFYLDFVPDDKLKISYAASFATDTIENDLKPFVKEKVQRINNISVRETSGLTILKELDIIRAVQVLDPVFLIPAEYWRNTFVKPLEEEDYIFVYDFDNNEMIKDIVQRIAKEHNLKIITVNERIDYANSNYWLKGPEVFLSLIANAKFVISNSFHAVAFSIIFEKQFLVVNRKEKINTRMRDLLGLLDLSHLIINENEKSGSKISIETIPSYNRVKENLKSLIKKSNFFLEQALN